MFFIIFLISFFSSINTKSLLKENGFQIHPDIFISPPKYNHSLEGPIPQKIDKSSNPLFNIVQWGIKNPIPLQVEYNKGDCNEKSTIWRVANDNVRICMYKVSSFDYGLELAQSGKSECGVEYDLFVSPTGKAYSSYPQNLIESNFSSFNELIFSFNINLLYSTFSKRCGSGSACGISGKIDYGYVVAAIVLDNFVKKQTLFYQISLFDTRQFYPECNINPCEKGSSWFFKSNPFGVNDFIGNFDKCLNPNSRKLHYELHIYDSIKNHISSSSKTPKELDHDIKNWSITGLYIGLGLQGSAVQTMTVHNITLMGNENKK